jgi:signal transduction histidine kinase/ActR/RegA family two-component response regulator
MTNPFTSVNESINPELANLIEHQVAVPSTQTVSEVYEYFQKCPHEFLAVTEAGRLLGMVSRGQIGFLLGARYGFAVYGRQQIGKHLLTKHLRLNWRTPLLEVFGMVLSRQDDYFYDDVALVDEADHYLGMISVQTLVRQQTQMITGQIQLAETQQLELRDKNQQLFRSVNELRQSRGRFEILFENSALGVVLLDCKGEVETCNQRLERLLGVDLSTVENGRKNLADLLQSGEREKFIQLLQQLERLPATVVPKSGEFTLSLPGRGPRLFKFFLNWIQETGQICALLDDITEQRVLERRMQQKEKSALLESLVGGIAHEINNKLSPIIGYVELLSHELSQLHTTKDLGDYCLIIRDSAMESAKIIRQLLQLSRPHKMEMARCDLKQIVQDAVNLLRFRLRNLDCQINQSLPGDECLLMADSTQIKQVVMNLILNAADAMEDSPNRQLHLRILPSGKHFHLLISDTGHGIKPEHVARIFDPFFTTKTPDRGTGLGLSVCYSVVKQHHGDISVTSTFGEGSTFKMTLPIGEVPAQPTSISLPLPDNSNIALCSLRVLIADDEEFVAGVVQEALRLKLGCQIDKAMDGREAIERMCKNHYDLVISDVRMPTLDGFGLLDWIRLHQPTLVPRFVFITGDAGSAELNQKLELSEVVVLRKPFNIETLLEVCRKITKATSPTPPSQLPVVEVLSS